MCVVLDLLEQYNLNPNATKVNILESSTTPFLGGTSAELLAGDKISVQELFYGMMLPSGNDAAQSLAIFFGNMMLELK
jgi:D-alanyl-D-alanine carboxypeptidase